MAAPAVLSDAEGLEAPSDDLLRRSREIAGELSSTSVLKVRVGAGAISFPRSLVFLCTRPRLRHTRGRACQPTTSHCRTQI